MRDIESPGQQQESLQMLQVKGAAARTRAKPDVPPELAEVLPISWVHVPKCGSSFINTLIHLPSVCPGLPEDLLVADTTFGGAFLAGFNSTFDLESACPGLGSLQLGHDGVDKWDHWKTWKGKFMIMLRNPEQRLVSAYKDMMNVFDTYALAPNSAKPELLNTIQRQDRSWGGWPTDTPPSLREFAEFGSGCATRMLVRDGMPCGGANGAPSAEEVEKAKYRLHAGFSFVGITDEWELSMCLFSKMFKVDCHPLQFTDARPGFDKVLGLEEYPEDLLGGYKDPYDDQVYAEALSIFEEAVKVYNVSEASCGHCFKQAGVSLASTRVRVSRENRTDGQH